MQLTVQYETTSEVTVKLSSKSEGVDRPHVISHTSPLCCNVQPSSFYSSILFLLPPPLLSSVLVLVFLVTLHFLLLNCPSSSSIISIIISVLHTYRSVLTPFPPMRCQQAGFMSPVSLLHSQTCACCLLTE